MTQLAYTVAQAAEQIGKSARFVDRAVKATDADKAGIPLLPSKRIASGRVILHADLVRWLEQLPDA